MFAVTIGRNTLSPFRSESTSAVFLTDREGRWGPELRPLLCCHSAQPSSFSLPPFSSPLSFPSVFLTAKER